MIFFKAVLKSLTPSKKDQPSIFFDFLSALNVNQVPRENRLLLCYLIQLLKKILFS